MPTVWEDSHIDTLTTLNSKNAQVQSVVNGVRQAIEPLILPDAAKVLAAIAADVMTGVQKRNDREDVNAACVALRQAVLALEAVKGGLDG